VRALELMTGDGYLLALEQAGEGRAAAESAVNGTLETLVVLNVVLGGGESSLFCLADERAAVLDTPLLRNQFTEWLRATPALTGGEPTGGLPIAMMALAFLAGKFPCADQETSADTDKDAELRARLLESLPK
jgi:hypothetical protein